MLDGRRPLLGDGVPRGAVGTRAASEAPCDVAVLVERDDAPPIDRRAPGDRRRSAAATTTGPRSSSRRGSRAATHAPMKLLGARAGRNGEGDASRVLSSASLVVQQLAGVTTEPVLVDPAENDLLEATQVAGPARDRPLRPLAAGGPRRAAGGDRQGCAGADPLRPSRHPAGGACSGGRQRDPLRLVARRAARARRLGAGAPQAPRVSPEGRSASPCPSSRSSRTRSRSSSSASQTAGSASARATWWPVNWPDDGVVDEL